MYLLKVPGKALPNEPLELVEVFGAHMPKYAILSHTWGHDEVLFRDIQAKTAKERAAYGKVRRAIVQARKDSLDYIWIDTCCIDKSSSAELQEAINSMYAWYARAEVCYAYLADLHSTPRLRPHSSGVDLDNGVSFEKEFFACKWFTRGWTLQELLAPRKLAFFASDWEILCPIDREGWTLDSSRNYLTSMLAKRTGIHPTYLHDSEATQRASVATKMSWAANRKTAREEDMAYCLLGIFDINMPMLYGEGNKAFLRLQEQIIRTSSDHSLFAWTSNPGSESQGLLALSPDCFQSSMEVPRNVRQKASPYSMTNEGLEIQLHLHHLVDNLYFADLSSGFGIYLRSLGPERALPRQRSVVAAGEPWPRSGNIFVRILCDRLQKVPRSVNSSENCEQIYVPQVQLRRAEFEHSTADYVRVVRMRTAPISARTPTSARGFIIKETIEWHEGRCVRREGPITILEAKVPNRNASPREFYCLILLETRDVKDRILLGLSSLTSFRYPAWRAVQLPPRNSDEASLEDAWKSEVFQKARIEPLNCVRSVGDYEIGMKVLAVTDARLPTEVQDERGSLPLLQFSRTYEASLSVERRSGT